MRHHTNVKPIIRTVLVPEAIDQAYIIDIWGKKPSRFRRLIRKLRRYAA